MKRHGDFGLGTYEGLDGELVMLDGFCYRVRSGGQVMEADDGWKVPFAVITRFVSDLSSTIRGRSSLVDLKAVIDDLRPSENLFVGVRVDGVFERLEMRAACRASPGEDLVQATSHQSHFTADRVEGTLVGFWAPTYAKALNVPGYHFHFMAADRSVGGHVFDLQAGGLDIGVHIESDVHLSIPETAEFLEADLRGDQSEALRTAESDREHGRPA